MIGFFKRIFFVLSANFHRLKVLFILFRQVKELESEVVIVGNSLRSMEISEKKADQNQDSSGSKVSDLQEKVNEVRELSFNSNLTHRKYYVDNGVVVTVK